jgi:hypothetical protein
VACIAGVNILTNKRVRSRSSTFMASAEERAEIIEKVKTPRSSCQPAERPGSPADPRSDRPRLPRRRRPPWTGINIKRLMDLVIAPVIVAAAGARPAHHTNARTRKGPPSRSPARRRI